MSGKCLAIAGSCVCFFGLIFVLFYIFEFVGDSNYDEDGNPRLILSNPYGPYGKSQQFSLSNADELKSPSLQSFIQASTTDTDDEVLLLSGLAVYSNLTNACQPLDDVSNAKIQLHKIALVTLVNESACTLSDLAVNTQNAGYSVLIYFGNNTPPWANVPTENKLMIPVMLGHYINGSLYNKEHDHGLLNADRTDVDITCPIYGPLFDELSKMMAYLNRLYYWFLVGPLITLEWLRRTEKLCWMPEANGNETVVENEIRTMEEGENGTEGSNQLSNDEKTTHQGEERSREGGYGSPGDEEQPLLIPVNNEHTGQPRGTVVDNIRNNFHKGLVYFCYTILMIAALPVGISMGGLSFFRFDRSRDVMYVPDRCPENRTCVIIDQRSGLCCFLWSPFQIFCFFMYSRFACNTTWTIPTNFSKLIRSDWFASNIYLVVLAVVVPYCTSGNIRFGYNFCFFATYNTVCTVCNVLFIIIVNKHKFVTRYVFFISVCMICAYIESDIVALFYFALNSEGSLINNLKLTALRTVAIGLTLSVSFGSSMHIIRKLTKPQESLIEGLSEN